MPMRLRTAADLGALIRDRRRRLGLDQASLARRVGVSRQWIVEVEKGKPRAELGLVLRTVDALGIALAPGDLPTAGVGKRTATVDLDAIVDAARRRRR
jgi:HTH-type transcriptional regulator/antitoxin HipB